MNIKLRLIVMSFLQFFVWGSWLITIGAYWFQTLPKLYPVIDETTHSAPGQVLRLERFFQPWESHRFLCLR